MRNLLLGELLGDFPFVEEADRVHALAALLLPFARRMIDGCTPLHLVESPTVGSGKTLLCKVLSLVATGSPSEARTLPKGEDELRKMLTAELASARPVVLLDNVTARVDSGELASVLTAQVRSDRLLGESKMLSLPNNAVWLLTGNNLDVSIEIARRSVRIRIDPKDERPWRREKFRHKNLEAWAMENRPSLVQAALTLVRAWLAAGRPRHPERLGSFEEWSSIMGGILTVAGIPGFLGNLEALYEDADSEGQKWREFVTAWPGQHGTEPAKVQALRELCESQDLLADVIGIGNAQSKNTRFGNALKKAKDRVVGGYKIVQEKDKRTNSWAYALQPVGADEAANLLPADKDGVERPAEGKSPPSSGPCSGLLDPFLTLGQDCNSWKTKGLELDSGPSGPSSQSHAKEKLSSTTPGNSNTCTHYIKEQPAPGSRRSRSPSQPAEKAGSGPLDPPENRVKQGPAEVKKDSANPSAGVPCGAKNAIDW